METVFSDLKCGSSRNGKGHDANVHGGSISVYGQVRIKVNSYMGTGRPLMVHSIISTMSNTSGFLRGVNALTMSAT